MTAGLEAYFVLSDGTQRDRREDIENTLKQWGVCLLGPGEFFVSGIRMPHGSTLRGMGEATRILLSDAVREGDTIAMASHCTVEDVTVLGAKEECPAPDSVGSRHGITFVGNATNQESCAHQPKDAIISGCRIRSFSGGGITCTDTGYSADSSLCVSNVRIHYCGVGINITHFSEYHKFSNVMATRNLYGCINNGGNNVFTGCSFDCNTLGYLIDNSEGKSKNNAHGSCVGCTFNHTDHNQGVGIKILGSAPGYVFSGCQMYYSKIVVENSQGIQFDHFNFGKNEEFHITGGGVVSFSGCLFSAPPTFFVENNENVKVLQCFTKGGTPVEAPEIGA